MSCYFLKDDSGNYQNVVTIYGQKQIVQCRKMDQAIAYTEKELPEVKKYFESQGITVFEKTYSKVKGRYRICP